MHIIRTISEFHRLLSFPSPKHPLVSVINVADMKMRDNKIWEGFLVDFYSVSLKKNITAKVKYGRRNYDFDKGLMNFFAPKQVQSLDVEDALAFQRDCGEGYMLLFHPDVIARHPLSAAVRNYSFFSYAVSEALHLSENEEGNILDILKKIEQEYEHIDRHTQDIILSQIELLLSYSNRFYERQFFTRSTVNHDILARTEQLLNDYFDREEIPDNGLPTVEYLSKELHMSAHYLSDVLRCVTGLNAQQHIHEKLIDKAKEYLSASTLSVAEIAYRLCFEYPQSFNKLFKKKTEMSPLEFRALLN